MMNAHWIRVLTSGLILLAGLSVPAFAEKDCGGSPCPGTVPAIWPDRSAAVGNTVTISGWNLAPLASYDVVVVWPDGSVGWETVTTDAAGELLQAPYRYVVGTVLGTYGVRLYLAPFGGDLSQAPVTETTFFHNNFVAD